MGRRSKIRWFHGALVLAVAGSIGSSPPLSAQAGVTATPSVAGGLIFPGVSWSQYQDVAQAGFSRERLARAGEFWERRGSPALMIVAGGAVVAAWGEVDRRFPVHSIRKSLLSAVYGAYADQIGLTSTLADLEVDERTPLSSAEKSAAVRDILTSSSGVYLPAVGETIEAADSRPERGSHQPGEFWWYNNWDFNVAGTIFERVAGREILTAFTEAVALPIGMEDWRQRDGFYYSDPEISLHRGFGAKMSTRDLARFGWLYATGGQWDGAQVLPEEWVEESTRPHAEVDLGPDFGTGYGYMWWVDEAGFFARGYGGHVVAVYPEEELVVVVRADTYHERFVSNRAIRLLLDRIRSSRVTNSVGSPLLEPLRVGEPALAPEGLPSPGLWREYTGETLLQRSGVTVSIRDIDGHPVLDYGQGLFELLPLTEGRFVAMDSRDTVVVRLDDLGRIASILSEPIIYLEAAAAARAGDVDGAMQWVSRAVEEFPASPGPRVNLARVLVGSGDRAGAMAQIDTALIIAPSHPGALRMQRALGPRRFLPAVGVILLLGIAITLWRRRTGHAS